MSVTSYDVGDRFIIRTVKALYANPDNSWSNSYEVVAEVAGSEVELLALANSLVQFEQELHHTGTAFQQFLISTWEPDSVPYDPTAFISVPLTLSGLVTIGTDALALNQCLTVARIALSGRFGHLFYRACLQENQVSAAAGKSVLIDLPGVDATVQAAISDTGIDGNFAAGGGGLKLCMINADGDQVRQLVGLAVQGVTTLPTDHAWFNRTTITVP
jgi:hypothetical protein